MHLRSLLVFASLLFLAACGAKTALLPGGVNVADDGTVTVETAQGTVTSRTDEHGTVELPRGFPASFPVMRSFTIGQATEFRGEEGDGFLVIWKTDASVDTVADYYKTELPKNGWQVQMDFGDEQGAIIAFAKQGEALKQDGEGGILSISFIEGKTQVQLSYGNQQ